MEFGDKLPNGAVVIASTITRSGAEGIVLAHFRGPQPWVTWTFRPGEPGSTGSGHYCASLADAVQDFKDRGGQA